MAGEEEEVMGSAVTARILDGRRMGWPWLLLDLAARRDVSEMEWVVWKKWSGSVEVVIVGQGQGNWRGAGLRRFLGS